MSFKGKGKNLWRIIFSVIFGLFGRSDTNNVFDGKPSLVQKVFNVAESRLITYVEGRKEFTCISFSSMDRYSPFKKEKVWIGIGY